MQGYKTLSLFAAFIYFMSLMVYNTYAIKNASIKNDDFLKNQLEYSAKLESSNAIILYGSSPVLYGLSANHFKIKTAYSTINMSTQGRGGQIEKFIELISNDNQNQGKIIILGDRNYRNSIYKSVNEEFNLDISDNLTPIINLASLFGKSISRDSHGDFINYNKNNFHARTISAPPIYTNENFKLMEKHINSVLSAGMCPIIVFIPLLVKGTDFEIYTRASEIFIEKIKNSNIKNYVATTPMIETDLYYFSDPDHMSALGREKWTRLLLAEITERQMCGITAVKEEI